MGIESIGRNAFDAVYEAYADAVYGTALRYTQNEHTAEEITQEVFFKLYKCMNHVDMEAAGKWLLVTVRNMALNHIRKCKRETLFEDIYDEESPQQISESAEDEFIRKCREKEDLTLTNDILQQLHEMNERWYEAVTLTYCLKKPQKETADVMNIPLETLHGILHRARRWIRKHYAEQYNYRDEA